MKHLSIFLTITVLLIALMSCDRDDAATDPPPIGPGTQEAASTPESTPASRRSPGETADLNRGPGGTATPTADTSLADLHSGSERWSCHPNHRQRSPAPATSSSVP